MNRTTVIVYGNVVYKRDLDDGTKIKNEMSIWGNGGWRSNAYHMDFDGNMCKKLHLMLGKVYEQFWMIAGVNITKTDCVIPAVS
ncbi:hypothetical protein LSTR_LSTR003605 [Laodelphax striatellus]|uniref:Uncharacterized protein n=1 Tax=Laodelphax striatellus TaxID=195883 RepID=A0A482WKY1_LAOST|nr:hypothetical protein LSTR_LSTR003605 [Laodelphax striatellus]